MSRTIELEVGDLYASLHEQFSVQVGENYEEQARQQFEEFLHNFNQQVEREVEQQQAQAQPQEQFDLTDEDVEEVEPEQAEAGGEGDSGEPEPEQEA